jgi:hypothetical protein
VPTPSIDGGRLPIRRPPFRGVVQRTLGLAEAWASTGG